MPKKGEGSEQGKENRQRSAKISILKPAPDHVKLPVHLLNPSSASVEKSQQAAGYKLPFLMLFPFLAVYCHTCCICPLPQTVHSIQLKQLKEKAKVWKTMNSQDSWNSADVKLPVSAAEINVTACRVFISAHFHLTGIQISKAWSCCYQTGNRKKKSHIFGY